MFFHLFSKHHFQTNPSWEKSHFFWVVGIRMPDALVLILCRKAAIEFLVPGETRQPRAVKKDAVPQNLCVPEKSASNEANQILVDGLWTKMVGVYFYVAKIGEDGFSPSGAYHKWVFVFR